MRASEAFVFGAIMGGVAVWLWGREIEGYVGEKTRGVRAKAVEPRPPGKPAGRGVLADHPERQHPARHPQPEHRALARRQAAARLHLRSARGAPRP